MAETLGTVLRQARKSKGETIAKVSQNIGSSPASISIWETDKSLPSSRSLKKLEEYYGISSTNTDEELTQSLIDDTPSASGVRLEQLADSSLPVTYNGREVSQFERVAINSFVYGLLQQRMKN